MRREMERRIPVPAEARFPFLFDRLDPGYFPGQNGFLAATDAEWVQALTCLADDAALRYRLGAQGRALVESRYSLQVAAPTLAAWLQELGARR